MDESWSYVWEVEAADDGAGRVRVSLVRRREHRSTGHHLLRRAETETVERTVFLSRSFRPMLESVAMDHYTARLSELARYAEQDQFGCFAESRPEGGSVEVLLWQRSFDGVDIHTEELARQAFDASDEQALVASVEFLADLRAWAGRRNDELEAAYLEERDADDARVRMAAEQEAAGRELSQILAAHTRDY